MKILPFFALFTVLISTSSYVSSKINSTTEAKAPAAAFKQFIVHRQASNVSLSWSVNSLSVAEFVVERSYDGDFFDTIGMMPCNGTSTHRYTDPGVFPGTIYYRITAVNADQSSVASAVETVRIVKHG